MTIGGNRKAYRGVLVVLLVLGFAPSPTHVARADDEIRVDHSMMPPLQRLFDSASDVTKACLMCHPRAGKEVMATTHWTWKYTTEDGQELGKSNVINNYCVAVSSNEPRCTSCHADHTHELGIIDDHTEHIACQTCHIPVYAKERYVKTWWDWSTAGTLKDGEGEFEGRKVWLVQKDENGNKSYMSPKGSFEWGKQLTPEYVWYNGNSTYVTLDDAIDPNGLTPINALHGNIDDPNALIFPVHAFYGMQPYDAGTDKLVVPNLFPTNPETAYWKNWDWAKAIEGGQATVGREFSGEYGFATTAMYWPLTHQVSPAKDALTCASCHSPGGVLDFEALGYSAERAAALMFCPGPAPEADAAELTDG